MTYFQAIGRGSLQGTIEPSPRAAAEAFFERYPTRKLCHIVEGEKVNAVLKTTPLVHRYWLHITRALIDTLPHHAQEFDHEHAVEGLPQIHLRGDGAH
jgi:hypothetical protein